jgi:glucose-6-phosphate dehydrogenase assembly protein OpcA
MATTYKVLGQIAPSAASATTAYTVPSATQAVVSTITACNQGAGSANVRIAVRPDGATIEAKHYVAYDVTVGAGQTAAFTIGVTADASDVITVQSSTANVSFNVFGTEIS